MSLESPNSRIEAFSDGVFAIAITLLILDIKIPSIGSIHSVADLWEKLGQLWPSYFAFVISFGFILVGWVNHHMTFQLIERSSPKFLFANGFLLLNFVLLPFPTALLAEYISTPYAQPAVTLYCFCYVVQNLAWNLLFISMANSKLLKNDSAVIEKFNLLIKSARFGFVVYTIITAVAWWFPLIALVLNTLLWVLWISLAITAPKKRANG